MRKKKEKQEKKRETRKKTRNKKKRETAKTQSLLDHLVNSRTTNHSGRQAPDPVRCCRRCIIHSDSFFGKVHPSAIPARCAMQEPPLVLGGTVGDWGVWRPPNDGTPEVDSRPAAAHTGTAWSGVGRAGQHRPQSTAATKYAAAPPWQRAARRPGTEVPPGGIARGGAACERRRGRENLHQLAKNAR